MYVAILIQRNANVITPAIVTDEMLNGDEIRLDGAIRLAPKVAQGAARRAANGQDRRGLRGAAALAH